MSKARLIKLPVISYNTGGVSDIIFDNKNGFLCSQKDYHALAEKMLKVSLDNNLRDRLSNFNDDLAEFSHQVMIKEHYNLYKNLY